mmetsp:Transcript_100099/g.298748  ORF Transcript_100099/g.298748 Transcript_100099/m.298748 type:complete len:343 (-) Transcript_100099:188-1216(-)
MREQPVNGQEHEHDQAYINPQAALCLVVLVRPTPAESTGFDLCGRLAPLVENRQAALQRLSGGHQQPLTLLGHKRKLHPASPVRLLDQRAVVLGPVLWHAAPRLVDVAFPLAAGWGQRAHCQLLVAGLRVYADILVRSVALGCFRLALMRPHDLHSEELVAVCVLDLELGRLGVLLRGFIDGGNAQVVLLGADRREAGGGRAPPLRGLYRWQILLRLVVAVHVRHCEVGRTDRGKDNTHDHEDEIYGRHARQEYPGPLPADLKPDWCLELQPPLSESRLQEAAVQAPRRRQQGLHRGRCVLRGSCAVRGSCPLQQLAAVERAAGNCRMARCTPGHCVDCLQQ